MQSWCEDTLEEWYAIKFYFNLGKMPQKRVECFRLLFDHLAWIECQFLSGIRDWCGRSKEVNRPELIDLTVGVRVTIEVLKLFRERFSRERPALFKSGQWNFHHDNAQVHNSILVTDYLTKMGIKTVPQPPYSSDFAPCDFWLFPKLRGCRYETIGEMKKAVPKVINTLTWESFHGALHKLLERHNKCIAAGGGYFEGE